jgi:hypothetical protein
MSIEKKSLIRTLKTTKKANIAKENLGTSKVPAKDSKDLQATRGHLLQGSGKTFQGSGKTFQGSGKTFQGSGKTFQGSGKTFQGSGKTFQGSGKTFQGGKHVK